MDYEFRKNQLDGSYRINLPIEHQTLGRWLIEELGTDKSKLEQVLFQISALRNNSREWSMVGGDLTIMLSQNEVTVMANHLFNQEDSELDFGMQFDDESNISACGFEDFEHLLMAWHLFYTTGR
jgi:uncharacterized protein YacL (UPF0231 family)